MNQILFTLGALTLGGSAAVLLLAWAGRSTRGRYGARWRCLAWLLLCLRLAVPLPLLPHIQERAPIQVDLPNLPAVPPPVTAPVPDGSYQPPEPSGSSEDSPPVPDRPAPSAPEPLRDPARILICLWILGAAAVLGWNLFVHLRFLRWLRRWAQPVREEDAAAAFQRLARQLGLSRPPRLLVCPGLTVPMLAGILRPAVLLPPGSLSGEELGFSLLHELTHFRRRDIWRKSLALWVCALHWFNPLMWLMVRLVDRDTELACDEETLRRLSPQDYSAYGQTILAAVARLQNPGQKGDRHV